jgi:uncharacterized sporulation protein YeaH/YhbH (DUF444 family)
MMAVFRPYSSSEALRSDRSAGDRQRHRDKLREAIRDNIADIISEESIIGRDKDRIIKVPIRGIKEYRFVFGDNQPQVGEGEGETEPGQVVGKARRDGEGSGRAGDQPGVDFYETDVTLEELIEIMFGDLELPDLERKILREVLSDRIAKRKGYRRAGVRVHLDRRRTARARVRRKVATGGGSRPGRTMPPVAKLADGDERFPFRREDLTYKRLTEDTREESNAVVICVMDTLHDLTGPTRFRATQRHLMIRHNRRVDPDRDRATTFKGHLRVLLSAMGRPRHHPDGQDGPVTSCPLSVVGRTLSPTRASEFPTPPPRSSWHHAATHACP